MTPSIINSTCTVAHEQCKCFEVLTPEQHDLVLSKQVELKYKAGEVITKHGAFASHIFFLCEGLVKVYLEDANATLILKIIGPGNLIGLTSLGDNTGTFQYTASAYKESKIRLIEISTFRQLIKENGIFASKIINIMSENAIQINNRFFFMTNRQSFGRMADLLLCLAGNIFKSNKFNLDLTRKELAELSGMSTENVIRVLKNFQNDGLIDMKGKSMEIMDTVELRNLCQVG